MTKRLLIANRGEIATRVLRTARRQGWHTIAIHSDLDADAAHVRQADEAHRVSSYLDIDEVVATAKAAGATHVHPGYGFLSERSDFARALDAAQIALVGPSADVMDAMGRKDHAREIALRAGVPVVPSYQLDDDPETFAYPVLVKAAAGGGGKGMRVVRTAAELPDALAAAARESAKAFGDDTLLIEKYVESGRHIEAQILADHHGNVRHFFERDCSTQRRHQKVLEEAPAPTITEEQRAGLLKAAVDLAAEVGYRNAGTVEFLLDNAADPATGAGFYFLEMNTRLQVEHPVTEMVTRLRGERVDLVALQLAVATGAALDFEQADVTLQGHAIEARVYAEDSFNGFLPQAGTATFVRWPDAAGPLLPADDNPADDNPLGADNPLRVDAALGTGQQVSTAYDPMLGKVICWGPTRDDAIGLLRRSLDRTLIFGLTTNTGFLRTLVASAEFARATIDTAWLDRHQVPAPSAQRARELAALLLAPEAAKLGVLAGDEAIARGLAAEDPWATDGFRLSADPAPALVQLDELVTVTRTRVGEHEFSHYDSPPTTLLGAGRTLGELTVQLDGETHEASAIGSAAGVEVIHQGQRFVFTKPDPFDLGQAAAGDGTVAAPMPGAVLQVAVTPGDQVSEGQVLGIMEAMKMELSLKAPFAGAVTAVHAAAGDQVKLGDPLFEVAAPEAADGAAD